MKWKLEKNILAGDQWTTEFFPGRDDKLYRGQVYVVPGGEVKWEVAYKYTFGTKTVKWGVVQKVATGKRAAAANLLRRIR